MRSSRDGDRGGPNRRFPIDAAVLLRNRNEEILREAGCQQNEIVPARALCGGDTASKDLTRRRSERVLLQIHVVVETTDQDEKHVRLDAFTLVVNAQGGLLEMGLKVPNGHQLLLINPTLGVQEFCHVVGIRGSQDGFFAVAFEFDNPSPQFWPIAFPPADWNLVPTEN
jgi:hypothetical protein